jgi:hypothetical protein
MLDFTSDEIAALTMTLPYFAQSTESTALFYAALKNGSDARNIKNGA